MKHIYYILNHNQYPLLFDDMLLEVQILLGSLFQHKDLKFLPKGCGGAAVLQVQLAHK